MISQNIQESHISGCKRFLGEFLKPTSDNVILSNEMAYLMIKYYRLIYVNLKLRKPFSEGTENDTLIRIKMSKFGRCWIGSEVFGLLMSL